MLVILLLVGLVLIGSSGEESSVSPTGDTASASSTRPSTPVTLAGPVTSIAGTGPRSPVAASDLTSFLRNQQSKAFPDTAVGAVTCPPGPYRVGHVILCDMELEGSPVRYRLEITGVTTYNAAAIAPIIDTNKAEKLVESSETGTTADCGPPRIRQLTVGSTFSCTTASSTWEFTVQDDNGRVEGFRR